jgi:diaminohydroxyphosphoribosylaminopyrimidine deaminase/5-amino-6-(5-phosphoribosylamino)uracil reductase
VGVDYMQQALSLARLALGQTSPNPAVGALLVKDGVIVGKGYTQPPGGPHAEIVALKQAGEQASGSTLYVTLEPCCHFGRTPPCTSSIIAAGVQEVHTAMLDPNPLVCGKGKAELENAGIQVYVGEAAESAQELNEAYIKYISNGTPFVTVKFAMSLDGKIATRTGDSKWISSDESRYLAHNLRYINDAIMTGVNTVLADNPQLTARCSSGKGGAVKKQPLRIIIDGKGRTPCSARIFHEHGTTLLVIGRHLQKDEIEKYNNLGAEVVEMPSKDGIIDLKALLEKLGQRQITSILVEGGGILIGSLFDQHLVDKVIAFIAPIIIGGEAKSAVAGYGIDKLRDAQRLDHLKVTPIGRDVMISGYVIPPGN